MKVQGQKRASGMCSDIKPADKIKDVKEAIKCNKVLIHYYQLLLDDAPENHLSFQSYLREIDKRGEVIKQERKRLIDAYTRGSNGEIPDLQRSNEELEKKLKTLRSQLSPEELLRRKEKKTVRLKKKAKCLIEKIAILEKQLADENWIDPLETDMEMES